jgi:hypothetical protein
MPYMTETRIFTKSVLQATQLRMLHKRYAMKIQPGTRQKAIEAIRSGLSKRTVELIVETGSHGAAEYGQGAAWWASLGAYESAYESCNWLLEARAALKSAGIDEKALEAPQDTDESSDQYNYASSLNVDDYIVGLVEMAVGLTDQSPLSPSTENILTGIVGRK